jgi:hypothetical protein
MISWQAQQLMVTINSCQQYTNTSDSSLKMNSFQGQLALYQSWQSAAYQAAPMTAKTLEQN